MLDEVSLKLLEKTKLSEKESRVYLAALQLGTASTGEIAKLAELKRPNTYIIIENLIANNYLHEIPGTKIKQYAASDPQTISSEMDKLSHDFREMLPYLQNVQRKAGKPYVTYYHGVDGARKAFSQIKRPREVAYAVSISNIKKHLPDEVARWETLYLKNKARPGGRHLLTDTSEDRSYGFSISKAGQIVRYLHQEQKLDMDLALFDGKIMLTAFDEDIHVTIIESRSLYSSLQALYNLAWKGAKKR